VSIDETTRGAVSHQQRRRPIANYSEDMIFSFVSAVPTDRGSLLLSVSTRSRRSSCGR